MEQVRALVRTAARTERARADRGRDRHRQGGRRARHPRARPARARGRSCRSTAPPSRRRSPRASSSATRAAPSPARSRRGRARSGSPTAARSSSTRSRTCRSSLQAKLLRVVQDGEVRPLGGSSARRVDVRLVAASNRELWRMVEAGAFRRDLYYRLRVLTIRLPPLRERGADLPLLVAHFVAALQPPARHALRRAAAARSSGRCSSIRGPATSASSRTRSSRCSSWPAPTGSDLGAVLRHAPALDGGFWPDERARILRVLNDHRWNRQRAAAALGISRVTLWRRMERHGIRDPLGRRARAKRPERAALQRRGAARLVTGPAPARAARHGSAALCTASARSPAPTRRSSCRIARGWWLVGRRSRRALGLTCPRGHRALGGQRAAHLPRHAQQQRPRQRRGPGAARAAGRALVQAAQLPRGHRATAPIPSRGAPGRTTAIAIYLGSAWADATGKWRIANLRQSTTVMLFPPAGGRQHLPGRPLTQLLPRACDAPGWQLHGVDAAHAPLAQREAAELR